MTETVERLNAALQGRYLIERQLGEGGMATVYLAEDLRHERNVAIKVLKPELAAVVGAERFLAEIKTTANLTHPNILPLHDSGQADGFLYYVMPYVEGDSLRDRLDREEQLPVDEAVRIAADLAEALDHAHRKGIVHRDIKPANVLLQDGRPVIADFGIALAVGTAGGARLTETGLSLGTPYYMSPEQALGDQAVTAASDIYALGCVVYELLAGEPPYTAGTGQAVLAKIITGGSRSVREARGSVPPNVDAALRRALERLPADRFPTAQAFRDALLDPEFRYGEEAVAPAVGWRRVAAIAGVAAIMGLLAGLGIGGLGSGAGEPAGAADARPLQLTFSGQARNPAISPDGTFAAFVDVACRQGSFGACTSSLQVKEIGSTTQVTVLDDAEWIGSPRWTYDGATLVAPAVLGDGREGLFAIPRMGGVVRPMAPLGAFDTHPSGDSLLVVRDTDRRTDAGSPVGPRALGLVIDLGSGATTDSVVLPVSDPVWDASWHPSGQRFALFAGAALRVIARDGAALGEKRFPAARETIRWNTAGDGILQFRVGTVREDDLVRHPVDAQGRFAGPVEVVRGGVPTIYSGLFDVARETGRLIIATGDARADIWSFRIDGPVAAAERVTGGTTWYGTPQISWDGGTAYYQRGDARGDNVYALDLTTGAEEALTASPNPGGFAVRLSPDGRRLAYSRVVGGEGSFFEVIEFPSRRISSAPNDIYGARPVPFGSTSLLLLNPSGLAVADSLGAPPRPLDTSDHPPVDGYSVAAVAPDGDRAAYVSAGRQGLSLVIRPLTGAEAPRIHSLGSDPVSPGPTWAPDGTLYVGRWLAVDPHPTVWRLDPNTGALARLTEVRAPCQPYSFTVDAGGERGTCLTEESRWDVWAFEGLGR